MVDPQPNTTKIDYGRAFNRLTHVIALSRTGKVEAVVRDLILTIMVIDDSLAAKSSSEISAAIDGYFGVELPDGDVDDGVDELMRLGKIIADPTSGRRVIQPHEQSSILERIAAASELEANVKEEWLGKLEPPERTPSPNGEQLWACLRAYLAKVLARHGAESILLLDSNAPPTGSRASLSSLQTAALREGGIGTDSQYARDAIAGFFTKPTAARTRYVAQLLDGTFSFFALSADAATEEYLNRALPTLSIFLDTNFIFGLLDLHENPLDSVSKELVDFIGSQRFPFRLYYHERTLDEIRRTLGHIGERLKGVRWSSSLSRAALSAGTLSSIELKFHELNAKGRLDVDVFLEKYERHIPELLETHGFKIYREPDGGPSVEERGRLVAEYDDYVRKARNQEKPYAAIDHDMSVWLSLQRLRKAGRSVLESGAMFLSNDFLLYRFDRFELTKQGGIQTVVMPGPLLQVLRPFGRSSDDFDRRFVATFGIPEFRTIHSDYAMTSSRVLSYLATYADMPEEMAVKILTNEVLIDRLRHVETSSPAFKQAVESEMIKENAALADELLAMRAIVAKKQAEQEAQLQRARQEAEEAKRRADALAAELEHTRLTPAEMDATEVAPDPAAADTRPSFVNGSSQSEASLRRRLRVIAGASTLAIGLLLVLAVPAAVSWDWFLQHENRLSLTVGAIVMVVGLAWAAADSDPVRRWVALVAIVFGMLVGIVPLLQ